jgi:trimeric autotransporter adhesin
MKKYISYMKAIVAILIFSFILNQNARAQQWQPLGLGLQFPPTAQCSALTEWNGNLYAAGIFAQVGGATVQCLAEWDGSSWSAVGANEVLDSSAMGIFSLCVYNGNLYMGGAFKTVDGITVNNIAEWNGTTWSPLGSGIHIIDSTSTDAVNSMIVYNGSLVVGGNFDTAGGIPLNGIAQWNGSSWSSVGSTVPWYSGDVSSFALYQGNLFAAGGFEVDTGIFNYGLTQWDGSTWRLMNIGGAPICVYGNKLIATAYNISGGIGQWNGTAWDTLAEDWSINWSLGTSIWTMAVYKDELYVGGTFAGAVGDTDIARWNGSTWNNAYGSFNSNNNIFCTQGGAINTLLAANGTLYAGGCFSSAGDSPASGIAQLSTTANSITKMEESPITSIYPNPAKSRFIVETAASGEQLLQVFDMTGRLLITQNTTGNQTTVDVGSLAAGIYNVSLKSTDGIATEKLVIPR